MWGTVCTRHKDPSGGFEPPNRAFCDTVMKFGTHLLKMPYKTILDVGCGARFALLAETPWGGLNPQNFVFTKYPSMGEF